MSTKNKVKANTDTVIAQQEQLVNTTPVVDATVTNTNAPVLRAPGRPPVPGSKRQLELAEKEQRKAANGGVIPKGRPVAPESKKQKRAAELARLKSLGLGKPGQHGMYLKKNDLLNEDGTINEAKCKAFHGIVD
jgi:hypothetical protein